ncbi:uncharacterized protein DS421_12g356450 [Arachis hypogaea]|nr:uncharacterized protein DS421_12g356450 [Arachis hypogaea]
MPTSPNTPTFVWYDAFNPQQKSSQHNIHLEKASVLFNLGALSNQISLSCDLSTVQGYRVAMDALYDASYWFSILWKLEAPMASGTNDLSANSAQILREIIASQIVELTWNCPRSHSDGSSLAGYLVTLHCRKAYDLSTLGPLAENLVQSSIPQFLESKMKTCHVQTDPSDVTQQFLSRYCEAQSLLQEGCQTPCLDLFFETVMIKDENVVINLRGSIGRIGGNELPGDHSNMTTD